jgi:hypothetical protein
VISLMEKLGCCRVFFPLRLVVSQAHAVEERKRGSTLLGSREFCEHTMDRRLELSGNVHTL